MRKVLRGHDVILRVPGPGRDADFWNAGASEAGTPWLLFVEAHGLPEPDCLSALVSWIATSPNGVACNFTIRNLGTYRVARLMKRWFAETHTGWAVAPTWRRLHRTACAIRRDVFEQVGPFEPQYGQFAPALLSARLDQVGLTISALPTSSVTHDDSPEMSAHHLDTTDYVLGEMDARASNDPAFFEKYFGPSPCDGPDMILSAPHARRMIAGLLAAARQRPNKAYDRLKQAAALISAALLSSPVRARMLAALTHADEYAVMYFPLTEAMRWKRFLLAHHRVVRTGQMRWMARNPAPSLRAGPRQRRWPIDAVGRQAIVGLHAVEYWDGEAFRWTHPVFLLRLALADAKGTLTLETRNVGRQISLSDIVVVVGGRILSSEDVTLGDTGNLKLTIEMASPSANDVDVVVIIRKLCEPATESGRGRRLGLPLFSVTFEVDDAHAMTAQT